MSSPYGRGVTEFSERAVHQPGHGWAEVTARATAIDRIDFGACADTVVTVLDSIR